MSEVRYDKNKNVLILRRDSGKFMEITLEEEHMLQAAANKEVYFREDVVNALETRIEYGELDESVLDNQGYINDLLDTYADLRNKYDGDADGLDWQECLDEAFERVPLEDYER